MSIIQRAIPGFTEKERKYFDQVARERIHQGDVTREEIDVYNEFLRIPIVLTTIGTAVGLGSSRVVIRRFAPQSSRPIRIGCRAGLASLGFMTGFSIGSAWTYLKYNERYFDKMERISDVYGEIADEAFARLRRKGSPPADPQEDLHDSSRSHNA